MKKLILPLLLLVAFGMLAAVESDPSDVVGYFKRPIAAGGWEPFSLPFDYADLTVDTVLGTQFADMDAVSDMATGQNAIYLSGVGFVGDLMTFEYGHAYWMSRDTGNGGTDFYLLGKVDPNPVTIQIAGDDAGNWAVFSLNEAAPVDLATLDMPNALDMDGISDVATGQNSLFITGVGWVGDLLTIEPTHVFLYNSLSATSYPWTYTPTRSADNDNNQFQVNTKRGEL